MKNNKLLFFPLFIFASVAFICSCSKNDSSIPTPPDDNVKFMVLSDLHYMHPDILRSEGKAFDEYNAEECKLLRESDAILSAAIEKIKSEKPDFVIICGDMTKDGEVICHQKVAEVLGNLQNEIGTQVYVVPGNHDMNNPHSLYYDGSKTTKAESADEEQFALIYEKLGYNKAVARREGSLDYMAYPAEGLAFIGVDSNEKNTKEKVLVQGGLQRIQTEWIKEMAQKAHSCGRSVILSMHHNLVDFYDNAQLIRSANIANARYDDYNNQNLIDDLCNAGIDVVFSGHSHMHSITSAQSGSHTIYSIVTSSLVNLPIAYRCGVITKQGKMTLTSGDLTNCTPQAETNLKKQGEKYWHDLADYYMKEAADKAWETAGGVFEYNLGFKDKAALLDYLNENVRDVFYTFLLRTSDGNEHLFTPETNYQAAEKALETILKLFEEKGIMAYLDVILEFLFETNIDNIHTQFSKFFHSAYFNYLGNNPVMPDDAIEIQLTR